MGELAVPQARVLYTQMDVVFVSNRAVASDLLEDVATRILSRAGDESQYLPLDYRRILLSPDRGGVMPLQVFPDIGVESFRTAVVEDGWRLRAEILQNLEALEVAHERSAAGIGLPTITGHWRFRTDTKQYKYWTSTGRLPRNTDMCSIRHWYYHIHVTEPDVHMRSWPVEQPPPLSKTRHYQTCNCEPPDCIPAGWPQPVINESESGVVQ